MQKQHEERAGLTVTAPADLHKPFSTLGVVCFKPMQQRMQHCSHEIAHKQVHSYTDMLLSDNRRCALAELIKRDLIRLETAHVLCVLDPYDARRVVSTHAGISGHATWRAVSGKGFVRRYRWQMCSAVATDMIFMMHHMHSM